MKCCWQQWGSFFLAPFYFLFLIVKKPYFWWFFGILGLDHKVYFFWGAATSGRFWPSRHSQWPMDMRQRWFAGTLPAPKSGSEARRPFSTAFVPPLRPECSPLGSPHLWCCLERTSGNCKTMLCTFYFDKSILSSLEKILNSCWK